MSESTTDRGDGGSFAELMHAKQQVGELRDVQGRDGNWNFDRYMHGLFNGLELAMATLEDREPEFRGSPESYLSEASDPENEHLNSADAGVSGGRS